MLPVNQNIEVLAMTLAAPVTDTALSANTFTLFQNYPNPFNLSTTIQYNLPVSSSVTIEIYDILGRSVQTIAIGPQAAGLYKIPFNGNRLSSGVYFCRVSAVGSDGKNFISVKKMLELK